jgi:hypothetical protein
MLRLPQIQFVSYLGFVSRLWSRRMAVLFIINSKGVPSVAAMVHLKSPTP